MPNGDPDALSSVLKTEFRAIWPDSPAVSNLDQVFADATVRRQILLEGLTKAAVTARNERLAARNRAIAAERLGDAGAIAVAERQEREAEEDQHNAEEALRNLDASLEFGLRQEVYAVGHKLAPAALSLSGGGIRSASFALGVLQALAEARLLDRFHYLSTVSGGGYIGSWLSTWLHWRRDATAVLRDLRPSRALPDDEPPPIRHLREYSSYLTPQVGLLSTDLWTAVTIVFRNLLLNWLILVPAIALPMIGIKLAAAIAHTARFEPLWPDWGAVVALFGLAMAGISFGYKLYKLYLTERPRPAARDQFHNEQLRFLWLSLAPAVLAGASFSWLANHWRTAGGALALWIAGLFGQHPIADNSLWQLPLMIGVALLVYGGAAIGTALVARFTKRALRWRVRDLIGWVVAAIVTGTLLWLGVFLFALLGPDPMVVYPLSCATDKADCIRLATEDVLVLEPQIVLVVLGMPWFLVSMLLGQMTYVLVNSYSREGDFEREWLGRAGGWYVIAALVWIAAASLSLLGSLLYESAQLAMPNVPKWLAGIGTAAGVLTAILGQSDASPSHGPASGWKSIATNAALALAGPLFIAILLVFISMAFDAAAFGRRLQQAAIFVGDYSQPEYWNDWILGLSITVGLTAIMLVAASLVNVNRFSMHALYRNRLIRAFLGGPHGEERRDSGSVGARRRPDRFTDFDTGDNPQVKDLWPVDGPTGKAWRPFHVVNIALNLAAGGNLAWQQRKAESFTVTPRHCGAASLGYRRTAEYGHPEVGISLGTAMAISGAAVSPNMGYHSSPVIAFLLTLLNVRLGWWLGNPGIAGQQKQGSWFEHPYKRESPRFALRPLFSELFGLTSASSPYVYLSDGGHFENLGVYEMVRRRCRWIVVTDAGEDGPRGFDDLGNLVRKAWIDLGVRISFEGSALLQSTGTAKPEDVPYYALGTIEYLSEEGAPVGHILYLKPNVRGSEAAADVIAYRRAHPEFPNQSTGDQWFDEPQLESYRRLGYHMMSRILETVTDRDRQAPADLPALFQSLETLDPETVR